LLAINKITNMDNNFVPKMYEAVDTMNSRAIADLMTADGSFRFANMPAVDGRENIFNFLGGFFQAIKGIGHSDLEYWFSDNKWSITGSVKYTRQDDSYLEVPFAVILKMRDEKIKEYLVFVDNHELFQ